MTLVVASDELHYKIRSASSGHPAKLAFVLQAALQSAADLESSLHLVRAIQNGLAATAEAVSRHHGAQDGAALPFQSTLVATGFSLHSLEAAYTPPQQVATVSIATGLLLAYQPHVPLGHPLHPTMCDLQTLALATLSGIAAALPQASRPTSSLHTTAGVACCLLLTNAFSPHCPRPLRQLGGLVSSALVEQLSQSTLPAPLGASAPAPPLAIQPYASTITSAFSAVIQNTCSVTELEARLEPLTTFVAKCALAHSSPHAQLPARGLLQQSLVPFMLKMLFTARRHVETSSDPTAHPLAMVTARQAPAEAIAATALQRFVVELLHTCSLAYDAQSRQQAPQLGVLLSSALAVLQGLPSAAWLLLCCVPAIQGQQLLPRDAPSLNHPACMLNKEMNVRTFPLESTLLPAAGPPDRVDYARGNVGKALVWGGDVRVQIRGVAGQRRCHTGLMRTEHFASCAAFIILLAVPCLPQAAAGTRVGAATVQGDLQDCAKVALPVLCQLADCPDATARAAAFECVLGFLAHAPHGPMWIGVLTVRWFVRVVGACPADVSVDEVLSAVRGVVSVEAEQEVPLACCQIVVDRIHCLLSNGTSALPACVGHGGGPAHGGGDGTVLEGLVGCLLFVVTHGDTALVDAVLAMLRSVWTAVRGTRDEARVAVVVFEHLRHCHDHRRKPKCVRWYHAQLRHAVRAHL
jgi:hypothetical protein